MSIGIPKFKVGDFIHYDGQIVKITDTQYCSGLVFYHLYDLFGRWIGIRSELTVHNCSFLSNQEKAR
jgi:hypothetical protein